MNLYVWKDNRTFYQFQYEHFSKAHLQINAFGDVQEFQRLLIFIKFKWGTTYEL